MSLCFSSPVFDCTGPAAVLAHCYSQADTNRRLSQVRNQRLANTCFVASHWWGWGVFQQSACHIMTPLGLQRERHVPRCTMNVPLSPSLFIRHHSVCFRSVCRLKVDTCTRPRSSQTRAMLFHVHKLCWPALVPSRATTCISACT